MTSPIPGRWTPEQAWSWAERVGWLVGCNFTPSTAANQLELWQRETFDPATIDRELGWAAELGMNVVRLYLHDLLFDADGVAFLDRVEQVVSMADAHEIATIPVLFDGVWHPEPSLGPQPDPTPRLHNSVWVQSPGRPTMDDPTAWDRLRPYVTETLSRFGDDSRIVLWDLFNEPDQIDRDTILGGSRTSKEAAASALVAEVFRWGRAVAPSQPLTVGVWEYDGHQRPVPGLLNEVALANSDVVTFHCYEPEAPLRTVIEHLGRHGRPLVCTEWLARTVGSTIDLLEVFHDGGVGALNWGLVDGRTQTRFPWRSWTEPVDENEPWFHELLHPDGRPYDPAEADRFRSITERLR